MQIYHDIGIPRPKRHDIEIPQAKNCKIEIRELKYHDIQKQGQLNHDIVITRHFFRRQKTATSRFQDQKPTTPSFCGVLTLMVPDTVWSYPKIYFGSKNLEKSLWEFIFLTLLSQINFQEFFRDMEPRFLQGLFLNSLA